MTRKDIMHMRVQAGKKTKSQSVCTLQATTKDLRSNKSGTFEIREATQYKKHQ
jgi:hypothetical protein